VILQLKKETAVNRLIVSIHGARDNAVAPISSCHLVGATNVEVPTSGHYELLFHRGAIQEVLRQIS
jgi:hypothetical protein